MHFCELNDQWEGFIFSNHIEKVSELQSISYLQVLSN